MLLSFESNKLILNLLKCICEGEKRNKLLKENVIDCNKRWRFQNLKYYDAWDYENSLNREILKAFLNRWWFVRNKDYSAYDVQ